MTHQTREEEAQWLDAMLTREGERGDIVPGGAQGGVVARTRRTKSDRVTAGRSAAQLARERVRFTAQALPVDKAA